MVGISLMCIYLCMYVSFHVFIIHSYIFFICYTSTNIQHSLTSMFSTALEGVGMVLPLESSCMDRSWFPSLLQKTIFAITMLMCIFGKSQYDMRRLMFLLLVNGMYLTVFATFIHLFLIFYHRHIWLFCLRE